MTTCPRVCDHAPFPCAPRLGQGIRSEQQPIHAHRLRHQFHVSWPFWLPLTPSRSWSDDCSSCLPRVRQNGICSRLASESGVCRTHRKERLKLHDATFHHAHERQSFPIDQWFHRFRLRVESNPYSAGGNKFRQDLFIMQDDSQSAFCLMNRRRMGSMTKHIVVILFNLIKNLTVE